MFASSLVPVGFEMERKDRHAMNRAGRGPKLSVAVLKRGDRNKKRRGKAALRRKKSTTRLTLQTTNYKPRRRATSG